VEEAVAAGIGDILLITSRGKEAIEDHFDRAARARGGARGQGRHRRA
jgi:UTP--glucose-1-phosphate uridylyltransferase